MPPESFSTSAPAAIAITGPVAVECVRALAAGLSEEARCRLLAESLPMDIRRAAYQEILEEMGCLSAEEGGQLVGWTAQGFARVAKRENCPHVKLGHKQPTLYPLRAVREMLLKLQVWPKGKPAIAGPGAATPIKFPSHAASAA